MMDSIIIVVAVVFYGGFYDWNVVFIGCFVCFYLISICFGKKTVYRKEHQKILWIPEMLIIFQLLASIWAIDRTSNRAGVIRGIIILLWMYVCLQITDERRKKLLLLIPDLGVFMVLCGGGAYFSRQLKSFFWMAERFGGFFQYANTCALFLFLGVVL